MTQELTVKVSQGKTCHEINVPASSTIAELKSLVEAKTNLQPSLQKLLFKGSVLKDDSVIEEVGLKENSKIILMASQSQDIAKVAAGAIVSTLLPSQSMIKSIQQPKLSEMTVSSLDDLKKKID